MRLNIRVKTGRPKTGRRGQQLNLYIPVDLVVPAKRHFNVQRGMSLSEGIARLLRKELKAEGAR